jgi:hypothetical protein
MMIHAAGNHQYQQMLKISSMYVLLCEMIDGRVLRKYQQK